MSLIRVGALTLALMLVGSLLAACGDDASSSAPNTATSASGNESTEELFIPTEPEEEEEEIHWGYEGAIGPENWASLSTDFEVCEAGVEQSPIDINFADAREDIPDPVLNWELGDLQIVNNGHTIQANVREGSTTVLNGKTYNLLQFHWHKPSEHTVEGDPFAMELHFVHADEDGSLAVLGVLIEEGAANPLYDELWAAQPEEVGFETVKDVDFTELLPEDLATYTYPGSLTTPPCSEGVAWNVIEMPATMSAAQLDAFLFDGNARPVQPFNDRAEGEDHEEGAVHWGYEGAEGPENWAALSADFEVCEAGAEQSPIDIVTGSAVAADIADPVLNWQSGNLEMINNGHTIQANVPAGSTTVLNGKSYNLIQFHWHKPSENTVDGDPFAMELHFVHADADGNLAVLGVLIDEGEALPLYDQLWDAQPAVGETEIVEGVDFSQLLPSDLSTYVFAGSLTTPPCSEGVAWNVLATPTTMSAEQLDAFLYEDNARPTQPVNDRVVEVDAS